MGGLEVPSSIIRPQPVDETPHGAPTMNGRCTADEDQLNYGVVVLSVNVSVLPYAPVRSGSLAAIDCLNVIGTDSLEVGAAQVLIVPRPCSGVARAKEPLTSRPVATELGSATLSVASPAVEITVAVVPAV